MLGKISRLEVMVMKYKEKVPREDERWNFNKAVETGGGGSSR